MYDSLFKIIGSYIQLNDDDLSYVRSLFKYQCVKKGGILINLNDISDKAFFINSGYLRYYKFVDEGEITIHLFGPSDFGASFCGFISGEKSNEILESVTDSELLYIEKSGLELLYNSDIKWQLFGRRLMEDLLVTKEKRLIDQISLTAEQRYIKLLKNNPLLVQQVPVQYIASYIGVQPESLSRIRRKIFS
jgi:CRP/FNR family transcriptional regulator, anaerobic regulatory protein